MKKVVLGLALAALVVATTASGRTSAPTAIPGCAPSNLHLLTAGKLTIGTDNPAFPPWWGGAEKKPFKISNPYSGKGYESTVAYATGKRLGCARSGVPGTPFPSVTSSAPGKKPCDFYLAQVSVKPIRAKAVTFSSSYYEVTQAVVGIRGKPIAKVKTVAGLKP